MVRPEPSTCDPSNAAWVGPVLLAIAVHLAVAVAIRVTEARAPRAPETQRSDAVEVVVEADVAPAPASVASRAALASITASAPSPPSRVGSRAADRPTPPKEPPVTAEAATSGATATEPGGGSAVGAGPSAGWFHPTATVDLNLHPDGHLRMPVAASEGRTEAPPVSTTGGLVESLDAADVARGLGRGGPVRSAVETAARDGEAPTFGVAVFAVAISADGAIRVDVTDASRDRNGWEGLGPAIRDALAKRPVRIPPNSRGLRVTVRVEASEQFPGGARPPPPGKTGASATASAGKVTETKDRVELELPYVALGYQGRNCGAGVMVGPGGISAGGGCNPGVAMRVVSARIVGEQRL